MDSFIKPLTQELAHTPRLSEPSQESLKALFLGKALGREVAGIKIWSPLGQIVFSNQEQIIGRTYGIFSNLQRAFAGQVVAEFDDLSDDENEFERSLGMPLMEIYAPIRESGANRIIAVAEFYEVRESLQADLRRIRLQTWATIASITIAMIALFAVIAVRQKRHALEHQVVELSDLLGQNRVLQRRIRDGQARMAEINELFLRRVSAELHDAPAQLIGFALLQFDALRPRQEQGASKEGDGTPSAAVGPDRFEMIRHALIESLEEIRTISAGLAPPELINVSLAGALEAAATRHAKRTGTAVEFQMAILPDNVDPALKVTLYRFVQEGLNNAFRHAGGRGQAVVAHYGNGVLEVAVSDSGQGFGEIERRSNPDSLGLKGLRGRIESIGGEFVFRSQPGEGTRLIARFNLVQADLHHA